MWLLKGNIVENVTIILFDNVSRITEGADSWLFTFFSSLLRGLLSRKTAEMSPIRCLVRCAQLGLSCWGFELTCGM